MCLEKENELPLAELKFSRFAAGGHKTLTWLSVCLPVFSMFSQLSP
jgi:hypothetical protein